MLYVAEAESVGGRDGAPDRVAGLRADEAGHQQAAGPQRGRGPGQRVLGRRVRPARQVRVRGKRDGEVEGPVEPAHALARARVGHDDGGGTGQTEHGMAEVAGAGNEVEDRAALRQVALDDLPREPSPERRVGPVRRELPHGEGHLS